MILNIRDKKIKNFIITKVHQFRPQLVVDRRTKCLEESLKRLDLFDLSYVCLPFWNTIGSDFSNRSNFTFNLWWTIYTKLWMIHRKVFFKCLGKNLEVSAEPS